MYPLIPLVCSLLTLGAATSSAADWPNLGGPLGRHAVDDPALGDGWDASRMSVAWRVKTAAGLAAGMAISGGQVFTVDSSADHKTATLLVLSLADGKECWKASWPAMDENGEGQFWMGNRPDATPALGGGKVVVAGPSGSLRAFDLKTHAQIWEQPGTPGRKMPSPVIMDDLVLINLWKGGKDDSSEALIALDLATGAERWSVRAPRLPGFATSNFTAPQVVTLDGVRQIVMHHQSGVIGISPDGKVLWTWDGYRKGTILGAPCVSPEGHIFVTSGHNGGSGMCRVTREDGAWKAVTVWVDENRGTTRTCNEVNGAAWTRGHFYIVGSHFVSYGLQCFDGEGKILWKSGKDPLPGDRGSTIAVNDRIVFSGRAGLLVAAADPTACKPLGSLKLGERGGMSPLAYADGRVLMRLSGAPDRSTEKTQRCEPGEIVCVDLRGRTEP
jgi:outer membrane protein assembly factor BamB